MRSESPAWRTALRYLAGLGAIAATLVGWWLAARSTSGAEAAWALPPLVVGLLLVWWGFAPRGAGADDGDRDHRQLLEWILDNLGEGVAVADPDGKLVLFNPTAQRILGRGPVDSGPNSWPEIYGLYHPDGQTPLAADELPLARAVAGQASRDVEMFVRTPARKGGVFIRVTATPLRDRDGSIKGGVAVFRDITQRKWSETVLRDSEERFRAIVQATASALIIVSGSGRIVEFNSEAERIFGRSRAEALDQEFLAFCLPAEFRQAVSDDLRRALAGEATPGFETPTLTRSGTTRTVLWTFSRLVDAEGRPEAVVVTGHDVTDRREADDALRVRELAAYLQNAVEGERKHLAREIHDELGQALTGLKYEVSHLSRHAATADDFRARLAKIGRSIDTTIGSVRRLAAELRPQVLDQLGLDEAIQWQAQEFESRTGIRCVVDLPANSLECGPEMATALFRIVQESLTNVARHADATRVDVRLSKRDDRAVLEVRDDGRGITTDEIASTRSFGLLGMHERARMLGGSLNVTRGDPRGTTVRAEMPC